MFTPRQKLVWDFIAAYRTEHGMSPTYQEIVDGTRLTSKGNVNDVITSLEKRGHIRRVPGKSRGYEPITNDITAALHAQKMYFREDPSRLWA